ncbi:hypothetical protein [Cytophaga sp. FL35]|uniref:hypothetical protein n=1 Tax=Cytophaga sp. FL35 TaxID=1904456 RepID=UPI00165380A8|nr:hypothetical protein [Cytophaga sp. FL35]MBC6998767.1 hypothetical protein [Cytophaga sp. FL35]
MDEEGTLHELKNDEKEILRNGKTYLVESYEYRTTLSLVLYKSESVLSQLSTLPFTRKSLIEIAKKYHQDIEKNDSYHDYSGKVSKANQSFGAILGVNHISVATNDNLQNQFYYFKETLDKKATSPVLGVFYKTNFPKINRNIFLQWSSYITFINLEWNQSRQESLYHFTETNNISSKRTFWSNNLSIKYEFPGDKLQPTFQIGAFNNLEFSSEYLHEYELQDTNGVTVSTNQTTESPFSKLSLGFLLGTGIQKNIMNRKIYIDLLYQRSGMLKKFEGMNQDAFFLNIGISLIQTTL